MDESPLSRTSIPDILLTTAVGQNLFRTAFKDLLGYTLVHYQLKKRFEKAATLLADGKYSIQQVAFMCGYKNRQANFSADFKRLFGMAPRDWRRLHL